MKTVTAAILFLRILAPCAQAADAQAEPRPLLPGSRIVTYYGNPLSKRMGVLGQLRPDVMLDRLQREAALWQDADSSSTVRPGLELVAAVASSQPGDDGLYRRRMPDELIERVIGWARRRRWLTILDVQVGRSSVRAEIERLRPYLEQPDVHLAIDPEFQMWKGRRPGERIGRSDAEDVNVAVIGLARIVAARALPPKLLIVHRFTDRMLRRASRIRIDPGVQIVVVMDGFGGPQSKAKVYEREIAREPVQYGGIKLFYQNDHPMMTRRQVLELRPAPRVIIYQ